MSELLKITTGPYTFTAQTEDAAPKTCEAFLTLLPFKQKIIQARWSGESAWVPLGDFKMIDQHENHTSYPSKGDILFYPGGISETEILFSYGATAFGSKMGLLAGNHFLTIVDGREHLSDFGHLVLWEGAQDITFEAM
ncbi:MAG: DUF3830 family protein [SAR202 cluster bacterium]|jgi:hypothetical protein|nr:DUF3830 family protein [SAR202 cluster bacterium]MDP6715943.1 DUF3830 family protein [SAR202 cluster bacterium]|tara:strand:- start:201 stop:614 length:414 start_codon:yes stop_codon:yes gene_type:complete